MQPRLTLQTLGRGDGLLGLLRHSVFGPRGDSVTLAWVDWVYAIEAGFQWATPAPRSVLNSRPLPTEPLLDATGRTVLLHRDLAAEADATDRLRSLGLHPLQGDHLQWRSPDAALAALPEPLGQQAWSLPQEAGFADLWADQAPVLQAEGWDLRLKPGFAHLSQPVQAWHLEISPESGEVLSQRPAGALQARPHRVLPLGLNARAGSWFLSLGVEVDGQRLDLAPLLADLLRRDARWLQADRLWQIDDAERISLRAPGGRRIDAPAGPIKTIVAHLLDLLLSRRESDRPWRVPAWDAPRLALLCQQMGEALPPVAGSPWQVQGQEHMAPWLQRLSRLADAQPVAAPTGLGVTLRDYQRAGLAWLQALREHGLGGVLADDMGLGKTAQTIAHLLLERQSGRLEQPALVVVPTSLMFNWQQELSRMAPSLRVLCLQGTERARLHAQMASHDVVLISYALLWRDVDALRRQPWQALVLDEAQRVKNVDSRSARALRRLSATQRLCLSGTPLENHLGELWALFDFLMPGFLGTARQFQQHWRKPIESQGDSRRAQLLAARVRPFILRRKKDEVARELPPKIEVTHRLSLQGAQRDLYESVRVSADHLVRRALIHGAATGTPLHVLDALLKLRQVCCEPSLLPGIELPSDMPNAKIEALRELLPTLVDEGRRVLVFSQLTGMLERVGRELDSLGLPWLRLTGATPAPQRGPLVQAFQRGDVPLFLISLKAGGTGLNLTAADAVVHLDPWWNPAVEQQATDRAHRLGQTQTVFVHRLVIQGSIEERMLELQQRKAWLAEGVLAAPTGASPAYTPSEWAKLLQPLEGAKDAKAVNSAPRLQP
jgi:superfamily II DNA or RNA helicase